MKRIGKFWFTAVFLVIGVVIISLVYDQFPLREVLDTFDGATPFAVFLFAFTSILIMVLHAWRWDLIIKTTGHTVPFIKVFLYKVVGFGISFITPFAKVGGEPLRAAMLSKHEMNLEKGLSTVVIDKIIDLSTTGAMFVLAVIIAIVNIALPESMRTVLIVLSLVFTFLIGNLYYQMLNDRKVVVKLFKFLRLHKVKKVQHLEQKLIDFDNRIVDFHKKKTKVFYRTVAISIAAWFLMFVEYKAILWIFGYDLGLLELFVIITIMGAAYVFPIPLALGVFEFGQAQTFSMLGLKAAAGIGLSILVRARDLTWTIIAVIILLFHKQNFRKAYHMTLKQEKLDVASPNP